MPPTATSFTILFLHSGSSLYFLVGHFIQNEKHVGIIAGVLIIIFEIFFSLNDLSMPLRYPKIFPIEPTYILIISILIAFRIFLIILLILCWKEFKTF